MLRSMRGAAYGGFITWISGVAGHKPRTERYCAEASAFFKALMYFSPKEMFHEHKF